MEAKVPEWLVKLLKASANIVQSAGDSAVMDGDADTADKTADYN